MAEQSGRERRSLAPAGVPSGPSPTSDEVVALIRTTRDAYLTLFCVTEDSVQVLLPNALVTDNFAGAEKLVEFPPPGWRARSKRRAST